MSDKLLDIAKANGVVNGNDWDGHFTDSSSLIFESEYQFRATIEQVCAPLVEALDKFSRGPFGPIPDHYVHSWEVFAKAWMGYSIDNKFSAIAAIKDHRTLIGDKE